MKFSKKIIYIKAILAISLICSVSVKALTPEEAASEEYILQHGHSPEIVRMINIQKSRLEKEAPPVKTNNWLQKFIKNLIYESDLTIPNEDFGYRKIKSVETR